MIYRAIGLMSGSSLDGLDIAFAEFHENGGKWNFEILEAECVPYSKEWTYKLKQAKGLTAQDYLLLHTEYGHYIGRQVNTFIEKYKLKYKVALIASHGHTTFHLPSGKMTAQLGDGAAIAAETGLPVVSDLRAMDVALGGQGAPVVPIGEKLLWSEYDYFLNIGGIANISVKSDIGGKESKYKRITQSESVEEISSKKISLQHEEFQQPLYNPVHSMMKNEAFIAFDICPANRVLNMLANEAGKDYDADGEIAACGNLHLSLLEQLNHLDYYNLSYPKSLSNEFGTDTVYPMLKSARISTADALRTYCEHIAIQVKRAIIMTKDVSALLTPKYLLVTGGGAFNTFLMKRLQHHLGEMGIEIIIPDEKIVKFKEALIMAFMGVLRWRQECNVMCSVTGASRDSIGGALWNGQEA